MLAWASYDAIADRYAAVAEPHYFARPAEDLVALLAPRRGARFVDAGAGSGAVARRALEAVGSEGLVVALDPAIQMLLCCRGPQRVVAALPRAPLRDEHFDVAAAAFVVTHLADPEVAVEALGRAVRIDGRIGLTSWNGSPASSAPGEVWQRTVAKFSSEESLDDAMRRALPSEQRFFSLAQLGAIFDGPTFREICVETRDYEIVMPASAYVESRLIAIPSRYLKSQLSTAEWERFTRSARESLLERFGSMLSFSVSVNFAVATRN